MENVKMFYDTNGLLNLLGKAFEKEFITSSKVLSEIEHIKDSGTKGDEIKFKARKLAKLLDENYGNYETSIVNDKVFKLIAHYKLEVNPDNIIMASAYLWNRDVEKIILVSDDINVKNIARKIFGLEVTGTSDLRGTDIEYTGYKDVILNDEQMGELYSNLSVNTYNCLKNEYLIVRNLTREVVDNRIWDGEKYDTISYKPIYSDYCGKIKPRNEHQVLAFDMLQNKEQTIKILSGRYGSGKDYLMISTALELIKQGKYDKILWLRNLIEVKNSKPIGFLPGSMTEKLLPYAMIMADHLGGQDELESFMVQGKIEMEHLGFVRGRDYKHTIIMCSEAENMTKEHIQLLIGRVGEGSALWLNGDYKQTDSYVFEGNNGLTTAIDKLKGNYKFGFVKLEKTERSETASMADLLD